MFQVFYCLSDELNAVYVVLVIGPFHGHVGPETQLRAQRKIGAPCGFLEIVEDLFSGL